MVPIGFACWVTCEQLSHAIRYELYHPLSLSLSLSLTHTHTHTHTHTMSQFQSSSLRIYRTISSQPQSQEIPLYLPFTQLLRTENVLEDIISSLIQVVPPEVQGKLQQLLRSGQLESKEVSQPQSNVASSSRPVESKDDDMVEVTSAPVRASNKSASKVNVYSCRSCRKPLFTSENLMNHRQNHDESVFHLKKWSKVGVL